MSAEDITAIMQHLKVSKEQARTLATKYPGDIVGALMRGIDSMDICDGYFPPGETIDQFSDRLKKEHGVGGKSF